MVVHVRCEKQHLGFSGTVSPSGFKGKKKYPFMLSVYQAVTHISGALGSVMFLCKDMVEESTLVKTEQGLEGAVVSMVSSHSGDKPALIPRLSTFLLSSMLIISL